MRNTSTSVSSPNPTSVLGSEQCVEPAPSLPAAQETESTKQIVIHQVNASMVSILETTPVNTKESLFHARHDVLSGSEIAALESLSEIVDEIEQFNCLMGQVALPAFLWLNQTTQALELHWQEVRRTSDALTFSKSLFSEASLLAHSLRFKTFAAFNKSTALEFH